MRGSLALLLAVGVLAPDIASAQYYCPSGYYRSNGYCFPLQRYDWPPGYSRYPGNYGYNNYGYGYYRSDYGNGYYFGYYGYGHNPGGGCWQSVQTLAGPATTYICH